MRPASRRSQAAELHDPVRRLEPQFDYRGRAGAAVDKKIWRHNDVDHLEELLAAEAPELPKLIVFEALDSMDGDIAPVNRICDVAERYDAMTYIDEVQELRTPLAELIRGTKSTCVFLLLSPPSRCRSARVAAVRIPHRNRRFSHASLTEGHESAFQSADAA